MCDGDDAVPLDHADFHEGAGFIEADEHCHRIVLHEVVDGETECVEHSFIRDAVPVGTVEDDRLYRHATSLLAARKLAKHHEGQDADSTTSAGPRGRNADGVLDEAREPAHGRATVAYFGFRRIQS